MIQQSRITLALQEIAANVKALRAADGNLSALNTTQKGSLVGAINEVLAAIGSASVINDSAGNGATTVTWSADKIFDSLAALKSDILGGASSAYDTLLEIQNLLGTDQTAISGLLTAVGLRVSVEAQSFTTDQKAQARTNIGALSTVEIGDPDHNFLLDYTTARDV